MPDERTVPPKEFPARATPGASIAPHILERAEAFTGWASAFGRVEVAGAFVCVNGIPYCRESPGADALSLVACHLVERDELGAAELLGSGRYYPFRGAHVGFVIREPTLEQMAQLWARFLGSARGLQLRRHQASQLARILEGLSMSRRS